MLASVSPVSSFGSSPLLPASPSSPLDVDLDIDIDIDADMHSVAPFSLSPAPSTASGASSAGSHPPSPYQLPQRVYPLRASSSLNSSPALSAFSAPTAQNTAAAARHMCAVHHTPVHHHHHHIHYTTAPAASSAAAPFKAAAVGIATSPQFNPPASPPTPSYMYLQSALPATAPPALLPLPDSYSHGMSLTTMHSQHTQYTIAQPYSESPHVAHRNPRHNSHVASVRVKREDVAEEVLDDRSQHSTAEQHRSESKRKRRGRGEDEQQSRPVKQRPQLHVSTSSTSLVSSSSSSSVASPPSPNHSSSALIFACPDCPRRFTRNSNLTRHKRIHSGQRRFTCVECNKGFMEKHHLTAHMRTHTGEKPYKCPQCPRQFTDRSNCSRHIRTHGLSPLGSDSEGEGEDEMVEAEEVHMKRASKREAASSEAGRHTDSSATALKVKIEEIDSNGAAEHEPCAPSTSTEEIPPPSSEVPSMANKVDEPIDVTSLTIHSSAPLLSTPLLQASPPIMPSGSPSSSYAVELRGRKDSLEPFNLSVGSLQSPLLFAAPSSPGRRSSFHFALSPALPPSSSPAMQLLSVSLSPALPPSILLSGSSRIGLIGEASPAPRVYSIASTMAAMTTTPSPATTSIPSQSADVEHSSLDVPSPSNTHTLSSMDVVAPSPRTHHAVTSLLSAANDAQAKHNHSQLSTQPAPPSPTAATDTTPKASKSPVSASEHLQALYDKVMAEKQHQRQYADAD